jgi:hypothetical protein
VDQVSYVEACRRADEEFLQAREGLVERLFSAVEGIVDIALRHDRALAEAREVFGRPEGH